MAREEHSPEENITLVTRGGLFLELNRKRVMDADPREQAPLVPPPPPPPLFNVPDAPVIDSSRGEDYFRQRIVEEFNEDPSRLDDILKQSNCDSFCSFYQRLHQALSNTEHFGLHREAVLVCRSLFDKFKGQGLAGHQLLEGFNHIEYYEIYIKVFQRCYEKTESIDQSLHQVKQIRNRYQAECVLAGYQSEEVREFTGDECRILLALNECGFTLDHLSAVHHRAELQTQDQLTALKSLIEAASFADIFQAIDFVARLPIENIIRRVFGFIRLVEIGEPDAEEKALNMSYEALEEYVNRVYLAYWEERRQANNHESDPAEYHNNYVHK